MSSYLAPAPIPDKIAAGQLSAPDLVTIVKVNSEVTAVDEPERPLTTDGLGPLWWRQ